MPRTGGTWIQEVLSGTTSFRQRGLREHISWTEIVHSPEPWDAWRKRTPFGFVRNPITWYQSIWTFYQIKGKKPFYPIPSPRPRESFRDFVLRISSDTPGALGFVYDYYLLGVKHIGRFENLRGELVRLMSVLGDPVHPTDVLQKPPRNAASAVSEWKDRCRYDEKSLDAVIRSERGTMKKYGYMTP